jgi:hypothetical protein
MIPSSACTPTAYGPICLTGNFPLGAAAPVDGGVEGGEDDAGDAGDGAVDDAGDAGDGGVGDAGDAG